MPYELRDLVTLHVISFWAWVKNTSVTAILKCRPFVLQIPQKVAKLMDNINKQLCGGLQPSVCLWTATRVIWSQPGTCACLTHLRNQPQEKQSDELLTVADAWLVSILLQNSIGNEKCHCHDVRFGMVFVDLVTVKIPNCCCIGRYTGSSHFLHLNNNSAFMQFYSF